MKRYFILFLLPLSLICEAANLDQYFAYVEALKSSKGNWQEGEIEVVTDPKEIARIQEVQEQRLRKKGMSEKEIAECSKIGVVSEDQYWILLRDAVYFPKGNPGTYNRLFWKSQLSTRTSGAAILPLLPSGKIILNLNYRHATRSWELEIPRGVVLAGESPENGATRELKEETGFELASIDFLGEMAPDSGVLSSVIPVYLGKIAKKETVNIEETEAIEAVLSFTKEKIQQGLIDGFIEVSLQNKDQKVPLRDPFLAFAILQSDLRHLW